MVHHYVIHHFISRTVSNARSLRARYALARAVFDEAVAAAAAAAVRAELGDPRERERKEVLWRHMGETVVTAAAGATRDAWGAVEPLPKEPGTLANTRDQFCRSPPCVRSRLRVRTIASHVLKIQGSLTAGSVVLCEGRLP